MSRQEDEWKDTEGEKERQMEAFRTPGCAWGVWRVSFVHMHVFVSVDKLACRQSVWMDTGS